MKLAIMQPYLFPYIGYFQLINVVDQFVIYDDVNFIKQGWINRNRILISGKPCYITVPLQGASSFASINKVQIAGNADQGWKSKWKKSIQLAYSRARHFKVVYPIIESVIDRKEEFISELAVYSLTCICVYLGIKKNIAKDSSKYKNTQLHGEDRVLDICSQERCDEYINAIGGRELYSHDNFERRKIKLKFLQSKEIKYQQFTRHFVPSLSIIDVLMHCPKDQVQKFLYEYDLL